MIRANRRVRQKDISTMLVISTERAHHIIHEILRYRKACAWCVRNILLHPPYSPDLTPCDFLIFMTRKEYFKEHCWVSDDEMQAVLRILVRKKISDFFIKGTQQLVQRWLLCVDPNGDYAEKNNDTLSKSTFHAYRT